LAGQLQPSFPECRLADTWRAREQQRMRRRVSADEIRQQFKLGFPANQPTTSRRVHHASLTAAAPRCQELSQPCQKGVIEVPPIKRPSHMGDRCFREMLMRDGLQGHQGPRLAGSGPGHGVQAHRVSTRPLARRQRPSTWSPCSAPGATFINDKLAQRPDDPSQPNAA
jgi:hypothetical protein